MTMLYLDRKLTTDREARTHNTGLAKVAVQCSADTFVVNQTLVLRINICGGLKVLCSEIANFLNPQNVTHHAQTPINFKQTERIMNIKLTPIQYTLITAFQLFITLTSIAQPGDRAFSIVPFDGFGYNTYFKIYSCSVSYPNSSLRSDSIELVWKPDLRTIKIMDTLQLVKVTNDSMGIPYPYYYQGKSCLTTKILMIIRDSKDTMLITTAGADPYALLVSSDWHEHGLAFIYPFQRGLFYLQRLMDDQSAKRLFYSAHRDYFFAYYNTHPKIILNPAEVFISYLKMNKLIYVANDTISITLTGRVLNDGGCASGSILWTLQKFENQKWIIAIENCCQQMDCGKGPSILNNTTIPLVLLKDKINHDISTYPVQREIPEGQYRFVFYDDIYQVYFTDEFRIK